MIVGWAFLPVQRPTAVLRRRRPRWEISPRSGVPDLATPDGRNDHPTEDMSQLHQHLIQHMPMHVGQTPFYPVMVHA